MVSSYKRNPGFDCLRLLCAFCVVCMHVAYPYKYLVEPWLRFAVPVFFMLSGYFYQGQRNHRKQIRKIFFLCIGANLLHFVIQLILNSIAGQSPEAFPGNLGSLQVWGKFLLLNHSPVSSPLWYLGAQLYVLVLVGLVDKGPGRKVLYPLIPVLLGLNLALGTYSTVLFGRTFSIEVSRNFLFAGLPFFLLGDLLRTRPALPKFSVILPVFAAGIVLSFLENYLLHKNGLLVNQDLFLGTVFLSWAMFRVTEKAAPLFSHSLFRKAAGWGHRYSLGIYILHPMVILACKAFLNRFGSSYPLLSRGYVLFAAPVVFIISLLLSVLFSQNHSKK